MTKQEQIDQHDPIQDTTILNRFDDESILARISTLSVENLKAVDSALNLQGLSLDQCKEIIITADEGQRKEIASLLADIRMTVDAKVKRDVCNEFAKYINSI